MVITAKKSIVTGALILTAAGIITRLFGFVYRIYMSNLIGAEGMGLYQLIMPVYTLAWSIACAGFNTTVSKLTAQEKAKGETGNMGRVLKQSVAITTTLGLVLTIGLFFGAKPLAAYFFNDGRTQLPLQILSLAFPFMAAGTCIRGYFIGLQETLVPAINQVLEQIVRMAVVYALAAHFMTRGLTYACAVAVFAIVCEEIFSFFFTFVAYKRYKRKQGFTKPPVLTSSKVMHMIFVMAIPLTANRVVGSLLTTLENVLIPNRLQAFGMSSSEAISVFGRISGMAMPLIYFPTAVLTSLSITLVPAVSEAAATEKLKHIGRTASKSVLFAAVSGFGAACLFLTFPHELGTLIYHQPIGEMLLLLGAMCPFLYMQIIFSGILNGLGCQVFIFRNNIISSLIVIAIIYFLVPIYGPNAFIAGWFAALIVVCALEIEKIRKSVSLETPFMNWLIKPVFAAFLASVSSRVAYRFALDMTGPLWSLILALAIMVLVYISVVLLSGCIAREDMMRFSRKRESVA